jgi:hypothetical protein
MSLSYGLLIQSKRRFEADTLHSQSTARANPECIVILSKRGAQGI